MWTIAAAPWLFADTNVDLGPALTQIGIGALIAVPAYALTWLLWKKLAIVEGKLEVCTADATNRERQLGQETYPMVKQMVDVLAASNRLAEANINAQQHPVQTPGIDPGLLRRVAEALEARP